MGSHHTIFIPHPSSNSTCISVQTIHTCQVSCLLHQRFLLIRWNKHTSTCQNPRNHIVVNTTLLCQLDQCNSVLVGTSVYLQDRLQSVLNAAALLVYSRRTSEHTNNPTATGASLVTRPGTNPVPVVCSGVPLCAWHSTGVPV